MKKKKLQKKYRELQKQYDVLWCEHIRLKEPKLADFNDEQILQAKDTLENLGRNLASAVNNMYKPFCKNLKH